MKLNTIITVLILPALISFYSQPVIASDSGIRTIRPPVSKQVRPITRERVRQPVAQSIRVLSPNGRERVNIGSNYRISWASKGARGNVSIRLMQKRRTIGTIAGSVNVAAGSYIWRVGDTLRNSVREGRDYKIRITSADGRISDISDGYFSLITKKQRVRRPGREVSKPDVTRERRAVARAPERRRTERSEPKRQEWSPPADESPGQQGGETQNQQSSDPEITITSPEHAGGWCTDSPHIISWNSSNIPASTELKIDLIKNDAAGTLWQAVTSSTPNDGSYEWAGISSADYNANSRRIKVRISTLDDTTTVVSGLVTFGDPLYFKEPNSGAVWRQGGQGRIRWEKNCTLPAPLNVDLLDSNHQLVQNLRSNLSPVPRNSTNKSESYNWPITTAVEPGSYHIRISSGSISMERAVTINEEVVFPTSPHFSVTSPQKFGGWCTDSTHTITWSSDLPSNTPVKIELMGTDYTGIVVWRTLAASTPNDGSYEWTGINSSDYNSVSRRLRVRISTLDDSEVTIGDVFSFGKPLYFHEPDAPYTWSHGSTGTIRWEKVCTQPSPITLDLLDSNHQHVMTIVSGLSAVPRLSTNKGEIYRWQVPATVASGSYFIRLSTGSISMEKPINIGN